MNAYLLTYLLTPNTFISSRSPLSLAILKYKKSPTFNFTSFLLSRPVKLLYECKILRIWPHFF